MISGHQFKAARVLLGWSQATLVSKSGVSTQTLQRIEKLGPGHSKHTNVQKLIDTLEAAGIEFINENGGGPGVRLRSTG